MAYKMQFQPAETLEEGLWLRRSELAAPGVPA
jgi:arginyl-tRNA--protein-N-Asp/Glu arginylyltransferase